MKHTRSFPLWLRTNRLVVLAVCWSVVFTAASNAVVIGWGEGTNGQTNAPASATNVLAITAGGTFSMALRNDGTVVGWGDTHFFTLSQMTNLAAISAGYSHVLGIQKNGATVGYGDNSYGRATPPPSLSNIVQVAAGVFHSMALRKDGTVVAWGYSGDGQTNVPVGLSGVASISAGYNHSVAVLSNGTVTAWGNNQWNKATPPSSMSNVVAVAAGEFHNLALKRDGTVTGWGIPGAHPVSSDGYSNYVAVSVGTLYSLALRANGTVVAWGEGASGETNIPPGLTNVVQIASYYNHNLALVGSPVALSASLRPVITLSGLIGSKVRIEYADQLGNTNLWLTLTNFTLPTSPYLFIDGSGNAYRFYRVVSSP